MNKYSTLFGLTDCVVSGPELMQNLQGWLSEPDANTDKEQSNFSSTISKIGKHHIDMLQLLTRKLYDSRMRYGGDETNRRIAITLLHEVSVATQEKQSPKIQLALYNIMAELAETTAKISWHMGLEASAQQYFQLALRASHAGKNQLYGARIFIGLAWQMHYLHKPQDMLDLMQLAYQGSHKIASPQTKAMLYMFKAWAYAAIGEENNFQRFIGLAEDAVAKANNSDEPYWVLFADESELASITGGGLRLLAIHKPNQYAEQASEYNAKAIALREKSAHSFTAQDYLGLAESRFLLKDTELAVDSTDKAIRIFTQLQNRCGATRRRLHEIYKYTNQANQSKQLQALNQKLKSVLAVA